MRPLSFLREEFVLRGQLTTFRKSRNRSLALNLYKWQQWQSQPMIVWIISNSKITFLDANYLTGNRPLTCKLITKRQRRSNTRIYVSCCVAGRKYGPRIERIRHAPRFMKTHSITIRLKNNGYPGEDLEKRNSGVIFCGRESILKNKEKSIQENIAFCNTISSGFVKPKEHTDGKMKL